MMERKIGEVFEYQGFKLITVKNPSGGCIGCYFDEKGYDCIWANVGYCSDERRSDFENVLFKLVK